MSTTNIEPSPPPTMSQFVNPWISDPEPDPIRLNAIVPQRIFQRIKQCRLSQGTMQTTINLLLQKLIVELDKRNITDCTDEKAYEELVVNCTMYVPDEHPSKPRAKNVGKKKA
jgi:hypothetical protein